MLGLAEAQAQESYIIVHALNPEGVEIASIEGMGQSSVEIFDGPNLIGYAPYNDKTHYVPIPIAPGTHTIRAVFNGMTQEQVITLDPVETREVVFTFERTNYADEIRNGLPKTYMQTLSADVTPSPGFVVGYRNVTLGCEALEDPSCTHGSFYVWNCSASASVTIQFSASFSEDVLRVQKNLIEGTASFWGDICLEYYGVRVYWIYHAARWHNIVVLPSVCDKWFVQGEGYLAGGLPLVLEEDPYVYAYFGVRASVPGQVYIQSLPPGRYTMADQTYPLVGEYVNTCGTEYTDTSVSVQDYRLSRFVSNVPYDLPGTGIKCEGECDFSAENPLWENEDDKMVLPYDEVDLKFEFTNKAQNPVSNVRVGFLSNSELFTLIKGIEEIGAVAAGGKFTATNRMKVAGTDNETIMEEVINKSRKLSLKDTIEIWVTANECSNPCVFLLSPTDDNGEILSIQYPDFSKLAGTPVPKDDTGDYYKRGDYDFHHPDNVLVRKYAIEASVWPDRVFPDEVPHAVQNIYNYMNDLLGDKEPGIGDIDTNIAARIENGVLEPHPGGAKDEYHLCIGQAYLFGSFARTIGVPAQEIDVALGRSIIQMGQRDYGIWYSQEAAIQVWCDGYWQLYDTFLGKTSLDSYLEKVLLYGRPCIKYRSWYSYDRRFDQMPDWPWSGHNFWIDPLFGHPWISSGWKHLQDGVKEGLTIVTKSPVHTYLCDAEGNITGYVDGSILEEIPDSYYVPAGSRFSTNAADSTAFWEADETIFAPSTGSSGDYSLVMTGTDDGHYELILAYVHQDGEIDGSTIPFDIGKDETHTYDITVNPSGEISISGVPARIDIEPDTMSLSALGRWVTCYIELPEGFDVGLIDSRMVELNEIPAYIGKQNWASAEANEWNITDHDEDGIPERMVKFDSLLVQALLAPGDATLTVYGELIDGTIFEGADNIRVINPRVK